MTVDESHEAIGLVWKGLSEKGKDSQVAFEKYVAKLHAAVLEGVRACRLLKASDYGAAFWRDLYVYVSQLLPNSSSSSPQVTVIALDTLLATPPQFLAGVTDLLPPHLCAVFANQNVATRTSASLKESAGTARATATATATTSSHALTRAQVQQIAEALEHIDLGQHGAFINTTTELLATSSLSLNHKNNGGAADAGISAESHPTTAVVSGWLLTLAHMPSVRQDCLFKTMSQLLQSSASQAPVETTQAATTVQTTQTAQQQEHINNIDLCELLLTQWISRGYVTQQVQRSFEQTMAALGESNHPGALAALMLAVFWPKHSRGQCVALYVSLLKGLREKLGRDAPDVLVASLNALLAHMQAAVQSGAPKTATKTGLPTFPPNTFYESLAWAADNLKTAIHLHDMYASTIDLQTPSPPAQPYWNISFWDKFAGQLGAALDAGKLTPGQVCHVLDLLPRSKSKSTTGQQAVNTIQRKSKSKATYKPVKELGENTVTLIEKLAVQFALASNMAPRRALRGVELCRGILTSNASKKARLALKEPLPLPATPLLDSSSSSLFSPTVLRAIFHLVTRDLDDSMPGRTSRLKWFLAIVARERGIKAATECERAIVRWRNAVKTHNKQERIRIQMEERELLEQMKQPDN